MKKARPLDELTNLSGPETEPGRIVPTGTARAKFSRRVGRTNTIEARAALHDLPPELVFVAEDLAALSPGLDADDREALRNLALAILLAHEDGSTRVAIAGQAGRAYLEKTFTTLVGPEQCKNTVTRIQNLLDESRADAVVGGPADYKPLILDGDFIYMQRLAFLERRFAENFVRRSSRTFPDPTPIVKRLIREGSLQLTDEQEAAVIRAASRSFTIVAGGPGTGKTSIVLAVIRTLHLMGVPIDRIAIAAPTGKATNRLRGSIEADESLRANPPEPQTLHRLLGYTPINDSFRHHENNRLAASVVIVDEASMVDLALMERLLRALEDDCRFVLLGDAEQLPSVDAGAVLRDLVQVDDDLVVRLTKNHRMRDDDPAGRAILRFATGVNEGRIEDDVADGVQFIDARSPAARTAYLARWFETRVAGDRTIERAAQRPYPFQSGAFAAADLESLEAVFAHHARAKLLCMTRHETYSTGANAVNVALHRKLLLERGLTAHDDWLPGEPILMLRNDYQRGLFNGDQGVVLMVGVDADVVRPTAVFRTARGLEAFPLAQLEHRVERAYAMTVHKAQGSELDHVGVVLPEIDVPLLTKEILYTAVTRARRSVTIVGHPELLKRAVGRPLQRESGLVERIRNGGGK